LLTVGARGIDLIFASIKTQALGETDRISARNWSAETLNGREDLLENVELNIWLEP
jgi:hypothetical protein